MTCSFRGKKNRRSKCAIQSLFVQYGFIAGSEYRETKGDQMTLALRRLLAYWLDFVLLAIILVDLQGLVYITTSGFPFHFLKEGYHIEIWVLLSMSLPVWLYFIWFELNQQQTLGKRMLKLKVTNRERSKITFRQAFLRTFIRLLPWELTHIIILVPEPWWGMEGPPAHMHLIYIPNLMLLLYILILFAGKGEKGVHDMAAKTMVMRIRDER